MGLAKKVLVADSVAPVANMVFGAGADVPLAASAAWLGVIAYTLQIYFDFSGYSDMAVGLSLLSACACRTTSIRPTRPGTSPSSGAAGT